MELPTYFTDFLSRIGPSPHQRSVMKREHKRLRELLSKDESLKAVLLTTFIQGSQRRSTATRGSKKHPSDVDVVAVTNLPRSSTTAEYAHALFLPFLERHYRGQYEPQERSWCITVDPEVKMDLVPTTEPESRELREAVFAKSLSDWGADDDDAGLGLQSLTKFALTEAQRDQAFDKAQPLWIPDRERRVWEKTHPLYLIGWTARKNLACNGHFTHVVKAIRWWRRHVAPLPERPKGYPLEHLVGECCPHGIDYVAQGVAATFAEMERRYQLDALARRTPFLPSRGVTDPEVDVMRRIEGADFAGFHGKVVRASQLAQSALNAQSVSESARLWRELLGDEFPSAPQEDEPPRTPAVAVGAGYSTPSKPAQPRPERFA